MGPLAVCYFNDNMVQAYLWAVLAADYDPVQQFTTTKLLVKRYIKPDELILAEKLIDEYRNKWKDKENCR